MLDIDIETSREYEREISRGCEGIRPGWVRVNFNYFISDQVFEFILDAVNLVADHGWRLLPQYRFDPITALWTHTDGMGTAPLSLFDVAFTGDGLQHPEHRRTESEDALGGYLAEGERILLAAKPGEDDAGRPDLTEDFERLRWFHLPDEMRQELFES